MTAVPPSTVLNAETRRLAALDSYGIIDTPAEPVFDNVVSIAAEICETPIAIISLIGRDRQWSKASYGLPLSETPREIAFCGAAIEQPDILQIEDATAHIRFKTNPSVVGDMHLRFYAGTPLINAEGLAIGTLCVIDTKPRTLTRAQLRVLKALGNQVMMQIELRKAVLDKLHSDTRNRLSEESLRRAQKAGGVGVFHIDFASNLITATDEFYRIFGISHRASIPAEEIESLVIAEDAAAVSTAVSRRSAAAGLDVEYRIVRPDNGEIRWIARRGDYERDANGIAIRLVGVVQDITERRQAQRALHESAAQFKVFAQTLPNHVWTSPPSGEIDWFNDRVYEYGQVSFDELKGSGWTRMVHSEDLPTAARLWAESLASGHTYETEFRLRRADGVYRWHIARALPIRSSEGAISRWVGSNTDIHEQKLMEAKTAQDRDRIWNATNDLMATLDASGSLTSVNPAWGRLSGYSDAELVGHSFLELIAAEDREEVSVAIARLNRGASVGNQEHRLIHKDGRTTFIYWSAEAVDHFYYLVARDTTEQRATESALRQSQKMEAVGQLTGGIAHDFNNLLQGITGSLDLVRKRVMQGRVSELDRFISGAMASANRASALTHRLLAFSRRQPLDPRSIRCNPLLFSMEDLLRRTLGEKIELELTLAGGLWLTRCDSNQLESAILNLVINARDAMPDGGKLTIQSNNAHLDSAYLARQQDIKAGQYVCIGVTDTGVGMTGDTINKAFEPFFTTKPIGQGTGLGLSMIYGFAKQSEGYAKIYSEVGVGTTVKLYLPRFRGKVDEDDPSTGLQEAVETLAHETVLVVEDEAVVRGLIVEVLNDLGYRALEAEDGPSGLRILQGSQRIDLLISDVGLPGLNGRQVADAARAQRPALKVLFMTGYAENAAIASGFLEPGMAMITKPFAMEALAAKIREMLQAQ